MTCGYCYKEDNQSKQVEDLEDDELVELDILLIGLTPIKLSPNAGKIFYAESH